MAFVADSSVSLRWMLPSQTDAASLLILERAEHEGLSVPALWHLEVANQLGLRLRSGKLSRTDFETAQRIVANLDIETAPMALVSPLPVLLLMERFSLTAYDAIYLDLARSRNLPLATFDGQLIAAAKSAGVKLLA